MKVYLSVVIPAYNEVKNIRRGVLESVYNYLKDQHYSWEVLIVDDGSSDESGQLLEKFAKKDKRVKVARKSHRGKGATVISGILSANGEIVLFTDMDQSTPIDQIEKFLPEFRKGADVVIGSRSGRPGQSLVRKVMAYGWVALRTLVLRLPYKDTQCGFKAFKKSSAREIFKKMRIFRERTRVKGAAVTAAFDLEMLYIARKLGLKVSEVPVEWYEYGERKGVSPLKDSWEGIRDLMRVRINALLGRYEV